MSDRKRARIAARLAEPLKPTDFDGLMEGPARVDPADNARTIQGVVVGTLVAFSQNGATPLVTFRGQPGSAALPARTTVDLHGIHIGRQAVLMFEDGDPSRPIIVGCIRQEGDRALPEAAGSVEVDADGKRLVVTANQDLVLRCGKASITLSKDGRIVVRGAHVVSHSSGLNRIRGGSVQIN
jgi:hypothetical protein